MMGSNCQLTLLRFSFLPFLALFHPSGSCSLWPCKWAASNKGEKKWYLLHCVYVLRKGCHGCQSVSCCALSTFNALCTVTSRCPCTSGHAHNPHPYLFRSCFLYSFDSGWSLQGALLSFLPASRYWILQLQASSSSKNSLKMNIWTPHSKALEKQSPSMIFEDDQHQSCHRQGIYRLGWVKKASISEFAWVHLGFLTWHQMMKLHSNWFGKNCI